MCHACAEVNRTREREDKTGSQQSSGTNNYYLCVRPFGRPLLVYASIITVHPCSLNYSSRIVERTEDPEHCPHRELLEKRESDVRRISLYAHSLISLLASAAIRVFSIYLVYLLVLFLTYVRLEFIADLVPASSPYCLYEM
jgi:hypothetical protein